MKALHDFKKKFDSELKNFLDEKLKNAAKTDPSSKQMLKLLTNFTLRGGKRLRPAFLYYAYKCFHDNNKKEILKAAISVELIHSYLLIHDDVIDKDDKRRNGLTIHKSYEKTYDKHAASSLAIITGDLSSSLAHEAISLTRINPLFKIRAIVKLNQVITKVGFGETLDIISSFKKSTIKDTLKIHLLKTASYTVEGPLHMGAILAGAPQHHLKIFSDYAIPLGKAFQIQDDILNIFGKKSGKSKYSDIKEGKQTLLILKAQEKATKEQKQHINKCLGNKINENDIKLLKNIIIDTGSLAYSQNLAKKLIQKSKKAITNTNYRQEGKKFLLEIADFMLEREF